MTAEPHKDRRALVRQLEERCRIQHAEADSWAAMAGELEASERERLNASASFDRLVWELEHAMGEGTEVVLTWDDLQALIARAGRVKL